MLIQLQMTRLHVGDAARITGGHPLQKKIGHGLNTCHNGVNYSGAIAQSISITKQPHPAGLLLRCPKPLRLLRVGEWHKSVQSVHQIPFPGAGMRKIKVDHSGQFSVDKYAVIRSKISVADYLDRFPCGCPPACAPGGSHIRRRIVNCSQHECCPDHHRVATLCPNQWGRSNNPRQKGEYLTTFRVHAQRLRDESDAFRPQMHKQPVNLWRPRPRLSTDSIANPPNSGNIAALQFFARIHDGTGIRRHHRLRGYWPASTSLQPPQGRVQP